MPAGSKGFRVLIMPEAEKSYDKLPRNVKKSMDEIMIRLRSWPEVSGVRSLFGKGYAPNKFRMKTWDWRIEFLVNAKEWTITVTRIGHRNDFYDEYH
jgi:mRNA-degrading endonuclease RelE of RelBE toxin-antitoxin system